MTLGAGPRSGARGAASGCAGALARWPRSDPAGYWQLRLRPRGRETDGASPDKLCGKWWFTTTSLIGQLPSPHTQEGWRGNRSWPRHHRALSGARDTKIKLVDLKIETQSADPGRLGTGVPRVSLLSWGHQTVSSARAFAFGINSA